MSSSKHPNSSRTSIRTVFVVTCVLGAIGTACTREAKDPVDAASTDGGTAGPAAEPAAAPAETPAQNPDTKSDVQRQFDAFVAERNACTSAADCALVSPGCPLGCGTGVRSEHVEAVSAKAAALIAEAERENGACAYRCAALHVECVEAHCTAIVE